MFVSCRDAQKWKKKRKKKRTTASFLISGEFIWFSHVIYSALYRLHWAPDIARNRKQQNISIFIKNRKEKKIERNEMAFCLLSATCVIRIEGPTCKNHKSHIKWTADFKFNIQKFILFFSCHFTALFCRNWSASIDPFSLSFHNSQFSRRACIMLHISNGEEENNKKYEKFDHYLRFKWCVCSVHDAYGLLAT